MVRQWPWTCTEDHEGGIPLDHPGGLLRRGWPSTVHGVSDVPVGDEVILVMILHPPATLRIRTMYLSSTSDETVIRGSWDPFDRSDPSSSRLGSTSGHGAMGLAQERRA